MAATDYSKEPLWKRKIKPSNGGSIIAPLPGQVFTSKEQQEKILRGINLGHGWFSDRDFGSALDAEYEAETVMQSGHHVALFMQAPWQRGAIVLWTSEVSSNDPLDRGDRVARWFDFRTKGG